MKEVTTRLKFVLCAGLLAALLAALAYLFHPPAGTDTATDSDEHADPV